MSRPAAAARPATARRSRSLNDQIFKWIMLAPAVIVVVGLLIFPMLATLYASFTDRHLYNYSAEVNFVGLTNWTKLVGDQFFRTTARNTLVFVLGSVPLSYAIGLTIALALNNVITGRKFFRVFFLMPLMISPVAIGVVIGRMLFNEAIGPINDILWLLGFDRVHWLTDPTMAMVTLIIIDVWHHSSFMILMLTAGLQSLPHDPYEAARVDGASEWQIFRHITFPLLAPISVTAILIRALEAFKVVDIIKVVTGGGPGQATETVTLAVYDLAVKGGDISYGAAAAYGLLIMMMIAAGAILITTRGWVRSATGGS